MVLLCTLCGATQHLIYSRTTLRKRITVEKHSDFGFGLDLTRNIYTMSHTFITASHHGCYCRNSYREYPPAGSIRQVPTNRPTLGNVLRWCTVARAQKRATHRIWVAMPSGFVAPMYIWNSREKVTAGLLVFLAYFY